MNEIVKIENDNLVISEEYVAKYKEFLKLKDYIDLADKEIKQSAIDYMEATGKKKYSSGWFKLYIS